MSRSSSVPPPLSAWTFDSNASYKSGVKFCPLCQSLLDLPDSELKLRCRICNYEVKLSADDYSHEKISVSTKFNKLNTRLKHEEEEEKEAETDSITVNFSNKPTPDQNKSSTLTKQQKSLAKQKEQADNKRAMMDEKCPKCNNEKMYYYTMQMRSVDEGQTVFFECPRCGLRPQLNKSQSTANNIYHQLHTIYQRLSESSLYVLF